MPKTRNTDRKQILQAALTESAGMPIVLEELRWRVMRRKLAEENEPVMVMTDPKKGTPKRGRIYFHNPEKPRKGGPEKGPEKGTHLFSQSGL